MFTKDSGLVKTWLHLLEVGEYKKSDVPSISNLKEVINELLIDENQTKLNFN